MPGDEIGEARDGGALAGIPRALDELHDAAAPAMAERAQQEPEGRRRLALARARVNDEQAFLGDGLGRDLGVLRGLALLHLVAMAPDRRLIQRFAHFKELFLQGGLTRDL